MPPTRPLSAARAKSHAAPPSAPVGEVDVGALQTLLDALPATHDAMDAAMVDGFLCGVLLQPGRIPANRWLPWIADADAGRALPPGWPVEPLHALVRQRHGRLDDAIERRAWFDPWVFADDGAVDLQGSLGRADGADPGAVYPWMAGFAAAMAAFPALMDDPSPDLVEPLAMLLRHLDPDDLDDADLLLKEIASLAPLESLDAAIEDLVRATLRIADVTRPRRASPRR